MPTLPRVYLIRHGETEWSISGRYTGKTDLPLTQHGEDQAHAIGRLLKDIWFDRAFSSPRLRSLKTIELAQLNVSVETQEDLSEWDYGDHEGQYSASLYRQSPDWNIFHDGCPKGETPLEVAFRADRLIAMLRRLSGNIALSSHGHFGRALAARWIGLNVCEARGLLLGTGSVSILDFEHERAGSPAIALWNACGAGCLPPGQLRKTAGTTPP